MIAHDCLSVYHFLTAADRNNGRGPQCGSFDNDYHEENPFTICIAKSQNGGEGICA